MTKALIPTEKSKEQSYNTKTLPKTSTDLGRSVGVTTATQMISFSFVRKRKKNGRDVVNLWLKTPFKKENKLNRMLI